MCNKSDADSSNIRMEKRRHKGKKNQIILALKEKEREDFTHHTQDVTKKGTSDRREGKNKSK